MSMFDTGLSDAIARGIGLSLHERQLEESRRRAEVDEGYRARLLQEQVNQRFYERARESEQESARQRAYGDWYQRLNPPRYMDAGPQPPGGVGPVPQTMAPRYQQEFDQFASYPSEVQGPLLEDLSRQAREQRAAQATRTLADNKHAAVDQALTAGQINPKAASQMHLAIDLEQNVPAEVLGGGDAARTPVNPQDLVGLGYTGPQAQGAAGVWGATGRLVTPQRPPSQTMSLANDRPVQAAKARMQAIQKRIELVRDPLTGEFDPELTEALQIAEQQYLDALTGSSPPAPRPTMTPAPPGWNPSGYPLPVEGSQRVSGPTDEQIDALTDEAIAAGHTTPEAIASYIRARAGGSP